MGTGLLLFSTYVAAPVFTHSRAADIPFGSAAFAAQWGSIEPIVPNFWGPAVQPAQPEPYVEASGGMRSVQYFDKARMEQTTASGPVTNGLLTVELISGQRQMGDTAFTAFAPSALPVVGDITNSWPSYAALSGTIFAARIARSGEPVGTVYKADGAFALNPGLAAQPGAAHGDYQSDPGGRYAHNIPLAFSTYLAALPLPWQTAMGFPLTEPFWVNVKLKDTLTWVLVQPFERRVLSYTPTNPPGFQVEMGNIGQHYYQWRYATTAVASDGPTPGATTSGATTTGTATRTVTASSGTPVPLAIASVQLGTVTETTCSLTFKTSIAATTEILYGTSSHAYTSRQEVSATATYDHTVDLSGLAPGTKYYFALHAATDDTTIQRKEDYFSTATSASPAAIAMSPTPTKDARTPTAVPTSTPTTAAISAPTATATATAIAPTATVKATSTATATVKPTSTPTATPTATPLPTATATTAVIQTIRLNFNQIVVGAGTPGQLSPSVVQLDSATLVFSLTADGSSGGASDTAHLTNWTIDTTNARASSTGAAPPLSIADRQTAVTLSATATIPFVDTTTPPLVVTFSRKLAPSEYAPGITITSAPLSNARTPGYNVTLTFTLAVV